MTVTLQHSSALAQAGQLTSLISTGSFDLVPLMAILQYCIDCCMTASRPRYISEQCWTLLLMLQQAVSQIPLLLVLRWTLHHPQLLPSPPQSHKVTCASTAFASHPVASRQQRRATL